MVGSPRARKSGWRHRGGNPFAEWDRETGIVSHLSLPIKSRGEVLGVLTFNTAEPRQYGADEMAYLASFADQAAIAIENARLYGEIQQHADTLEARVRERTAELENALRVKVEFLGKMSHGTSRLARTESRVGRCGLRAHPTAWS